MEEFEPNIGKRFNFYTKNFYDLVPKLSGFQWQVQDKITQYKCIQRIYQLNYELQRTKNESELKEKKEELFDLERMLKEKQLRLNDLINGECQRMRVLLKEHNEVVNNRRSAEEVIEIVDCRLYDKRKTLDRLRYEQSKLVELYDAKLKYLDELKNRQKYRDPIQLIEEIKVKKLKHELNQSAIQIRTYESLIEDCTQALNTLEEFSFHYNNKLDSLKDDVNEQKNILYSINFLGKPAYISCQKNTKELQIMELELSKASKKRLATITAFKRELLANEANIFSHIPNDEYSGILAHRYILESPTILNLRLLYEKVHHETRLLGEAAASSTTEQLFETVKGIYERLQSAEEKVNLLEQKLSHLDATLDNVIDTKDSYQYNVTQKDLDLTKNCNQVEANIKKDISDREVVDTKLKGTRVTILKVQYAMQHLDQLLKNVGSKRHLVQKPYPNELLSYPLLELHNPKYVNESQPPEIIQEDINELFKGVFGRVEPLVSVFDSLKIDDSSTSKCIHDHHKLVLLKLEDDDLGRGKMEAFVDSLNDPNVHSREKIKEMSKDYLAKALERGA